MKKLYLFILIILCVCCFNGCKPSALSENNEMDELRLVYSNSLINSLNTICSGIELSNDEQEICRIWAKDVADEQIKAINAADDKDKLVSIYDNAVNEFRFIRESFRQDEKIGNWNTVAVFGEIDDLSFTIERGNLSAFGSARFHIGFDSNSNNVEFKCLGFGCKFMNAGDENLIVLNRGEIPVIISDPKNAYIGVLIIRDKLIEGYAILDYFDDNKNEVVCKAVMFTEPTTEDEAIARIESAVDGDWSLKQNETPCVVTSVTESKSDSVANSDLVTVTGLGYFEELSVLLDKSENSPFAYEVRVKAEGEEEETLAFNGGDTVSWTKNKSGYMAIIGYENDCPTFVSVIAVQYSGEIAYAEQFTYCFSASDCVPIGRISATISYYGGI